MLALVPPPHGLKCDWPPAAPEGLVAVDALVHSVAPCCTVRGGDDADDSLAKRWAVWLAIANLDSPSMQASATKSSNDDSVHDAAAAQRKSVDAALAEAAARVQGLAGSQARVFFRSTTARVIFLIQTRLKFPLRAL